MTELSNTPRAILRFRFFCVMLCILYVVITCVGIAIFFVPVEKLGLDTTSSRLLGVLFLFVGVLFFTLSYIGLHMPRRPGAWTFNRFLLFLGISSILLLPFSLILLSAWVKPEVLEWYGID